MIEAKPQYQQAIAKTLGLDDPDGKHPFIKKRWLWWLLAGIIVSIVIIFVVQNRRPEQVQYQTEQVRRGDLVVTVSATGTLPPVKEVEVGIEVSGTIKTVLVDYNDRVKVRFWQFLIPPLRDRSRVVPRSDKACVFTKRSVVKIQAL